MEHFINDPDECCFVRTVEDYYRHKDALLKRKLLEYTKKLTEGAYGQESDFKRISHHK